MKPTLQEYPAYYGNYIQRVNADNLQQAFAESQKEFLNFIRSIDPQKENHAYGEGKWSIKEVILHCSDTERIFCARALGYARGEQQKSLPFEENDYAKNCKADERTLKSIIEEYETVAHATRSLFNSFSEATLKSVGQTPSGSATVNAMGFIICGHNLHHMNIIKERYL